ncbi:MAG: hypothetical protein PWR03_237 [Tenuifilum sp.]|jgi:hypothetical protein|nr:hypothetical protein [Tenuifilum sp.]
MIRKHSEVSEFHLTNLESVFAGHSLESSKPDTALNPSSPENSEILNLKSEILNLYPSSPDKSEILNYCHAELVEASLFRKDLLNFLK